MTKHGVASIILALVSACTSSVVPTATTSAPTASPAPATTAPTALASRAVRPIPVASLPIVDGSAQVPTLDPSAAFADTRIDLRAPSAPGQPAQSFVWKTEPLRVDAAYMDRIATALGITGPGTRGVALEGTGPWRVWVGPKILAISEADGTVLFFDPRARDAAAATPADPVAALERLFTAMGRPIDNTPGGAFIGPFQGSADAVASAEQLLDGSWAFTGAPGGALLFPEYPNPWDPVHYPGARIYDTDAMALLTTAGAPVELVYRPIGRLVSGERYWVTNYGTAVKELAAHPARYLRFVSGPTGGKLDLELDADGARQGYAWADFHGQDMTRSRSVLVPVWTFRATGTNASGDRVRAMFVLDAVVPEMRRFPTSRAINVDADRLMRDQLTVSVGGHHPDWMSPSGAIERYYGADCVGSATVAQIDADTASASIDCHGALTFATLRRAFPGLETSVWYVSKQGK